MNKRIIWIDILRIIGMIGVITIHIVGNTINTFGLSGIPNIIYTIISNSFYFTISLFVMVSGSLLLNKDIGYKEIFSKYIKRMLLVLIIFGGFYAFLEEYYISRTINITTVGKVINCIITGELWDHMWYIYLMIALYLITPILRKYIKNSNNKEQITLLIVLFIFTIIKTDICNLFKIKTAFYIPFSSNFLFAYLLGNYLYNNDLGEKTKTISHIIGFLSFIAIIVLSYFKVGESLIAYTSLLCTIVATDIYITLKNKDIKNKSISNIISELGKCSLGIYILHQLFINILYKVIKFNWILSFPYIGLVIYVIGIFIITFILVYILRKSNIIKKYIL